jgi:hypothetical protein
MLNFVVCEVNCLALKRLKVNNKEIVSKREKGAVNDGVSIKKT